MAKEVYQNATFAEITGKNSSRLTMSLPEAQDSTEDPQETPLPQKNDQPTRINSSFQVRSTTPSSKDGAQRKRPAPGAASGPKSIAKRTSRWHPDGITRSEAVIYGCFFPSHLASG